MSTISPQTIVQDSCNNIVNSVHDSNLNFSMTETPYSLYITVRKSLLKSSQDQVLQHLAKKTLPANQNLPQNLDTDVKYQESVRQLKNEMEAFKTESNDALTEANRKLEVREEIIQNLKTDKISLENELEANEKNLKDSSRSIKAKDKELLKLRKDESEAVKNLETARTELKDLKLKISKEIKDEERKAKKIDKREFLENLKAKDLIKCDKCDIREDSLTKLKNHMRTFHVVNKLSQTEEKVIEHKSIQHDILKSDKSDQTFEEIKNIEEVEFVKYPCHYCRINIANEYHLCEQRVKCRGTPNMCCVPGLPPKPPPYSPLLYLPCFTCEYCGWIVRGESDLRNHKIICLKKPKVYKFS